VAYVIKDSGARTVFVEDAAQLAKVLEARGQIPQLEHIVVMSGYDAPQPPKSVMTWQTLRRTGRDHAEAHKSTLAERVTTGGPEEVASIVYTSGTTGPPKGVVQTHGNHVAALAASKAATPVEEGWVHLLFLPLAHSFARLESFLGVAHGLTTAFAENLDKLRDNLPETRPHFICSVPRVELGEHEGMGQTTRVCWRRRSRAHRSRGRSSTGRWEWGATSAVTSSAGSRSPPGSS
jgi:long-chain acyl-CoA synthetase